MVRGVVQLQGVPVSDRLEQGKLWQRTDSKKVRTRVESIIRAVDHAKNAVLIPAILVFFREVNVRAADGIARRVRIGLTRGIGDFFYPGPVRGLRVRAGSHDNCKLVAVQLDKASNRDEADAIHEEFQENWIKGFATFFQHSP